MRTHRIFAIFSWLFVLGVTSCQTGEEAFVDDRLRSPCEEAYYICNMPAGCVIDQKHYVEGAFPGTRRIVVRTEERDVRLDVKIYISSMAAPGTEILVQAREPDCTIDKLKAQENWTDVDIFDKAGDDRTLSFPLEVADKGEHLLEIYSDASADYVLIVNQR